MFCFSFGPETTNVWQLREIRERISLDTHCPVVLLESELVTMGVTSARLSFNLRELQTLPVLLSAVERLCYLREKLSRPLALCHGTFPSCPLTPPFPSQLTLSSRVNPVARARAMSLIRSP